MTALKPLYKEATPSSLISSRRTSRKPLGYFPSGAETNTDSAALTEITTDPAGPFRPNKPVWKRDLRTSGGIATAQLQIPAIPPANRTLGMLSSLWLHREQDKRVQTSAPRPPGHELPDRKRSPFSRRREEVFQPLVRHEVHSTGRDVCSHNNRELLHCSSHEERLGLQ